MASSITKSADATSDLPTAIDIFAGAGGLTEGLVQAGFRVVGAIEVDPVARQVYALNHGDVPIWGDIRTTSPEEVMTSLSLNGGDLDLLAGCPPCQGFSRVRTLNRASAIVDERNELIFNFLDYIAVLRPKAVMLENVPGLATDSRMREFLSRVKELGYFVGPRSMRILDTADYGVPQRRRRLFFATAQHKDVRLGSRAPKRITVRQAIGWLAAPPLSGDPLHDMPERRCARVQRIVELIPPNGGSRSDLPEDLRLNCHKRAVGFSDVYGRMSWDDVAPTITAGCYHPSKGRFLHPEQDRTITMREAALLQGFPPHYEFPPSIGKIRIASLIGNALPPPFVARHASKIREVIRT